MKHECRTYPVSSKYHSIIRAVQMHPDSSVFYAVPGLELFGAERVCDIFNGVTQTVCIVVRGVYAPVDPKQTKSGRTSKLDKTTACEI